MRLIDADRLASDIRDISEIKWGGLYWFGLNAFERVLALQPSIDRESVQHGRWYRTPELTDIAEEYLDRDTWKCTVCGSEWAFIEGTPEDNGFKYCPECGAKMDGERREDETD